MKIKRWISVLFILCIIASVVTLPCIMGVAAADDSMPSFTSESRLPTGKLNEPYYYKLQTEGGTPGYKYSFVNGILPTGLKLSSKGVISGTPTRYGNFPTINIAVTDAAGKRVTKRFSLSITAVAVDFVVTDAEAVYDGQPHAATVTPMIDGEDASGSVDFSVWYGNSTTLPTNAGAYQLSIYPGAGYRIGSQNQRIFRILGDSNSSIELSELEVMYDGNAHEPSVTVQPEGLPYRLDYYNSDDEPLSSAPVEPGVYTVRYTTTNPNYAVRSGSVELRINKIPVTVTAENTETVYNDGLPVAYPEDKLSVSIPAEAEKLGALEYKLVYDDLSTEDTEQAESVTAAGSYAVYIKAQGGQENYYDFPTQSIAQLNVKKKTAEFEVTNNVYIKDDSNTPRYATVTPINAPELAEDNYTVTYYLNGAPVAQPIDVGGYDIYVSVNDTNYEFEGVLDDKLTIEEASKVPIIVETYRVVYSGAPQKATVKASDGSGYTGNITVKYRVGEELVDEVTNAGTYPIVVTLDEGFEVGTLSHDEFIVEKKPVQFSLAESSSEFNGNAVIPTVVCNPADMPPELYTVDYSRSGTSVTEIRGAGDYTVNVTLLNDNYVISGSSSIKYTVKKKPIVFTAKNTEQTITGGEMKADISVDDASLVTDFPVLEEDYTVTYYKGAIALSGLPKDAGEYRIRVDLTHDNYSFNGFLTETFKIKEKNKVNFSVTNERVIYSGEAQQAVVTAPEDYEGGFTVKYRDAEGNLTDSVTNAGTYDIVISLDESVSAEYEVGTIEHETFVIEPKSVTFMLASSSAVYDGNKHIPVINSSETLPENSFSLTYRKDGAEVTNIVTAGRYTVGITMMNGNYSTSTSSLVYTVNKRAVSFEVTNNRRLVTGERMGATIDIDPSCLVSPGDLTMEQCRVVYYNGGVVLGSLPRDVGIYRIHVEVTSDNYSFNGFLTDTFEICAPAQISFTVTNMAATYNGRVHQATVTPPEGYTGGFKVQYRDAYGILADSAVDAGTYDIIVTPDDETEQAMLNQNKFTVLRESVEFSLKQTSVVYREEVNIAEFVDNNSEAGQTLNFAVDAKKKNSEGIYESVYKVSDVGEYELTIRVLDRNHSLSGDQAPLVLAVTPSTVEVSLGSAEAAYTGVAVKPELITNPSGLEEDILIKYQQGSETFEEIIAIGEYDLTFESTDPNYTVSNTEPIKLTVVGGTASSIRLSYGNTPSGRIAREISDATERETLLNNFSTTYSYNGGIYSESAWTDTNYDLDMSAVAVTRITDFSEPGFVVYDCDGNPVAPEDVSVSISGVYMSLPNGEEKMLESSTLAEAITELENAWARLGIFTISYSYGDITASRALILLPKLGDANLDDSVNGTDADYLTAGNGIAESVSEALKALYTYRVCDVNRSGVYETDGDISAIENRFSSPIVQFYK